jgi:DNA-binding beta-propeller fold protein YncE
LVATIPLPGLKPVDFDHFAPDLASHRMFLTAEKNGAIVVFDVKTNKVLHTITGLEEPHSMVYRNDLKKLFVVDGGAAQIKVYDGDSYKLLSSIKLEDDADSSVYDPSAKYLWVVNGGKGAKQSTTLISAVNTTAGKKIADMKVNTDTVEQMQLEKSGPRLFVNLTGLNTVGVFDRGKQTQIASWPVSPTAEENGPIAFDEADHRLFVVTLKPAKLLVMDSDTGRIITSLPCVGHADEASYDAANKRIYIAGGQEFIDVFQQKDADTYTEVQKIPTRFRAKTAIYVPELSRYYLAVPGHAGKDAEVRVYSVLP